MAQNMQEIKRRMKSIQSTEHITNAMRLVSASKYKKAKNIFDKTNRELATATEAIEQAIAKALESLAEGTEDGGADGDIPFLGSSKGGKTILIAVTSSKGLCGGFNANVNRAATALLEELGIESKDLEVYAIGNKGLDFFSHNGYEIMGTYLESAEKFTFADASQVAKPIIEQCVSGQASRVLLIYTRYINSLRQEPTVKQLIPIDTEALPKATNTELEFVPGARNVLEYMIPKYFEMELFKSVIESAACEHAARRTAMDSATDSANDMLDKLSLTYNRVRQSAITNEIIEIVSGAQSQ